MKVYFISILLLSNELLGHGQEKHVGGPASETTNSSTLVSQSQLLLKTESNNKKKVNNTLLEAPLKDTEKYNESNTNTSNEDKKRIFDLKSKQHITIETDILTDSTEAISFRADTGYKTQNIEIANKTNNETVSFIDDSRTQPVSYTRPQRIAKTNSFSNKHITLNESEIRTDHKARDLKTKHLNITIDTANKIENGSSIQRTTETKYAKMVKIPSNNKNSSSIMRNFNERHEKKRLTCEQVIVKICDLIESSQTVPCGDDTTIPLKRLCDGYIDCPDKSDEESCSLQVVDQIQLASTILLEAETSKLCMKDYSFLEQIKKWQNMLKLELKYIYVNGDGSCDKISSIYDSFQVHLCKPIEFYDVVTQDILKLEEDLEIFMDNNEKFKNVHWSPISCTCNQQFCRTDHCDSRCRRICWQVYVLNQYVCPSITGTTTVPLDYICDGKIDCIDETDEVSCMKESSTYKHKASTIYNELLGILSREVVAQTYEQDKVEALINLVSQLQTLTTRTHNPDINTVKSLRDKYFKLLVTLFKKLWPGVSVTRELNNAHDFLLLLNQNMIRALKSSYTGNKHVHLSAECYCKNNICGSKVCSRMCKEFCITEPILTEYRCDGNSTFVSIEVVCDGKEDCPSGDDEKGCRHEVCRERQLDNLRLYVEKAEKLLKEIVFGKVLEVWKSKIMQTLIITENEDPNRKTLVDKVGGTLRVLLEAYSSMLHTSGTNYMDINGFISVSNMFKQALKSCNK